MTHDRANLSQQDHGFTLVEVLVVTLLIGILAAAVTVSFIVFVRTDDSVVERLTNSADLQNLESFLPGDVASSSTIEDGSTVAFGGQITDANCLSLATTPVLRLGWDQRWRDGTTTEYEVVYDLEPGNRLVRWSCVGSTSSQHTVARHFTALDVALPPGSAPILGTVEIVLRYPDDDRRLAASSRNYIAP